MRVPESVPRAPGVAPVAAPARVVCAILAALAVASCGGDSEPPAAPRPLSATAERIRVDGFATTRSRITVAFPEEISLELEGEQLSNVVTLRSAGANADFRPADIPVTAVSVNRDDPTQLIVETDSLVGDGSELRVHRSALVDGGEGTMPIRVSSDLTPFDALFAARPLVPGIPELFGEGDVPPVLDTDRDPAAMREALDEHLEARGSGEEVTQRALEVFDSIDPAVVTSPKIAAALASLTGTFAESAVENLLTAANCTGQPAVRIAFEPPPNAPDLVARVTHTDTGARVLSLNPRLEGEVFQLIAPVLAHEAIHCDELDSLAEELVATAFDAFLYLHYLAAEPWLAEEPTVLAHNYNSDALALLNSGLVVPETVGVLPSPGDFPVLQGSDAPFRSFAEYIADAYSTLAEPLSPTEELAFFYATNLAAIHGTDARDPFDIEYLDALLGLTIPTPVFNAAVAALGLELIP